MFTEEPEGYLWRPDLHKSIKSAGALAAPAFAFEKERFAINRSVIYIDKSPSFAAGA